MQKNKIIGLGVLILVIVALLFVFQTPKNKETIKIGGLSALTGVGAAIGEEERKGMLLAVEEINAKGGIHGRNIELVSEDLSLDKIKQAVTITQKLINADKVVALVGPQWDEPAGPILPIIEESKIPTVGADNSDQLEKDVNYEYFFSTWYDNRVGVREILKYADENNIRKITIIKLLSAGFWEFTAQSMIQDASKYNVQIVDVVDLGNPLELDFRTVLLKASQTKPDAIFIVTSDYNQCVFLKQKKDLGINIKTFGTESSGDSVSLKNCPDLMEERLWSAPKELDGYKNFQNRFEKRFGEKPKFPSAANAYDSVMVIAEGLKKTKGVGNEALRDAIAEIKIKGVSLEDISFNEKGFVKTPEDTFIMKTMKEGNVIELK
jgi:branched-chain amino acid transport system substrate-binding protein